MAQRGLERPFSIDRRRRVGVLAYFTKQLGTHPEIAYRADRLLVSINDRLGGKAGEDIEPLGQEPLNDIMDILKLEGRQAERMEEEFNAHHH